MSENIKNRIELVYIYDVRDANPNGDPENANMPRIDEETGENIVTDVRLKRTIRDYWISKGKKVLIQAVMDKEGHRLSMEDLVLRFLNKKKIEKKEAENYRKKLYEDLPKNYIDIRTFGGTIPLTNANISITGPVQFGLGRSINIPEIKSITITTTLASKSGEKGQGTFGEYHIVDYSLIRFHGLINEIAAKETKFSNDDFKDLLIAMWEGTQQLNTRSKFNHSPRLCIAVVMDEEKQHIGDLDLAFKLYDETTPKSIEQVKLEVSELINKISDYKDAISQIKLRLDPKLTIVDETGTIVNLETKLKSMGLNVEDIGN
ncbi:MAG: type I-B CRISPR-associated protein Cas7/Csh2 [Promethearchaeota archaeon]